MYNERQLVKIAKRENNRKRNYLVVNPLQGKHIPVIPSQAFLMFEALAVQVQEKYSKENILFIGFAETATAIGAAVASVCNMLYMQTTREHIQGVEYLYFNEEHSHATEQKLVKNALDRVSNHIERIIFVEDEVTTGKTILNITDILNAQYPQIKKYAVASLLNGMDKEAVEIYRQRGIDLLYLVKTNHQNYPEIAEQYVGNGLYVTAQELKKCTNLKYQTFKMNSYIDARRLVEMKKYNECIEKLYSQIEKEFDFFKYGRVLVLGTEELMYPALRVAQNIEKKGIEVRCHATTRSPIMVSAKEEYPLHKRFELMSFYDKNRKTYIYDLCSYDCVLVITDAFGKELEGCEALAAALQLSGNKNINMIWWG